MEVVVAAEEADVEGGAEAKGEEPRKSRFMSLRCLKPAKWWAL